MPLVAGEATAWHDGVVVNPEAMPFDAGYVPYECQYYDHHPWELPVGAGLAELAPGDAGSALAHDDDGWVHAAGVSSSAAATSPTSSSVLTFDGADEYTAASWMDMDAHATEPQLVCYGPTAAATSTCCFSFGGSGDSGMVITPSAASGSQKRARSPQSPSQGAELQESKKQRAKEPQSSAAKSRRERISERLRALQELVPSGGKVDMVTMLDKAITYVKFLQLQLRVLETDAFWPAADGTAPDISQVKDAFDAIILSSSSSSQQACRSS
ncbi:hypothetical protein E2562_000238 [Oryza meyeriana var. granulata]|uniref:BHLH domain-containing protein n=1 Tax=Oryza meyeriana var. granulata TaxID=110450 RepID=A0A6G1CNH7_9ORYZ|nr:hypothetical protein E2562_000238 [Oryza meyeriana var. granulata]